MRFLLAILLFATLLNSASLQDIQNIGSVEEIQKKLETMKNSSQEQEIETKEVKITNNIATTEITKIPNIKQESAKVKSGIFQYKNDDTIIKERNSLHISTSSEKEITRFGDKFFQNKNLISRNSMPIPNSYRINKGDIISVWIYGGKNQNSKLEVDRNGNINIDRVGSMFVYNLTFQKMKKMLAQKYKSIYKNIKINIDLDRTTPIQITIAGEVNSAGIYNIPAFSTIKDALIVSKGISQFGSFRNIKLIRNGRFVKTFDIYKLIENGDSSYLKYILKNGDGIIIAKAKKNIQIRGEILKSGIYELKRNENLKDLLKYAGGLKIQASKTIATLERYSNNKRIIKDISISKPFKLQNGDKITVLPINLKNSNSVFVYGNVVRVGERGFSKGLTLYKLFQKEIVANGIDNLFLKNLNMDYAVIKRLNLKTFSDKIITFNLEKVLFGKIDIPLMKNDEIYIFNRAELKENPYIYISGKVVENSGKYNFFENMKLGDIQNFVKFKSEITIENNETKSEITIENHETNRSDRIIHNISKAEFIPNITREFLTVADTVKLIRHSKKNQNQIFFLNLDKDKSFKISEFDEITFFDKLELEQPKFASISGEVFESGKFIIDDNTDINKLIKLGQGLKKEAYLQNFEVTRYSVVNGEREYKTIRQSLKDAMKNNFKIQEFDEVTIFKIPKWNKKEFVTILGEVKFAGRYLIQKGDTLEKVIQRAGGYLDSAFFEGSIFTRDSIKALQKKQLENSIRKLKQNSLYLLSQPSSMGEGEDKTKLMSVMNSLITELSTFEPNGRIVTQIKNGKNFILEGGDTIIIPTINETVTVIGEVLNPNSFFYQENLDIEDYIEKSGGINSRADIDNIYIVHSNGEAEKYQQSYLFSSSTEIGTGDTIIIPMKIETSTYTSVAKDISQILYQFAITAISLKTVGVF